MNQLDYTKYNFNKDSQNLSKHLMLRGYEISHLHLLLVCSQLRTLQGLRRSDITSFSTIASLNLTR